MALERLAALQQLVSGVWPEWTLKSVIGRGACGVVCRALRTGGVEEAAIKLIEIPLEDSVSGKTWMQDLQPLLQEIRLMEQLGSCENIVRIQASALVPRPEEESAWLLIRMERLTPLNQYLAERVVDEELVRQLGCDICRALETCEAQNILHRDIKPENILVSAEGLFKLGDFGVARHREMLTGTLSLQGTTYFMAPEVLNCEPYDRRTDIYSLGLVLYRLLNDGRLPFLPEKQLYSPRDRQEALRRRMSGEVFPAAAHASEGMMSVLHTACDFDPAQRYAHASDFRLALEGNQKPAAVKKKRRKTYILLPLLLLLLLPGVMRLQKRSAGEPESTLQETESRQKQETSSFENDPLETTVLPTTVPEENAAETQAASSAEEQTVTDEESHTSQEAATTEEETTAETQTASRETSTAAATKPSTKATTQAAETTAPAQYRITNLDGDILVSSAGWPDNTLHYCLNADGSSYTLISEDETANYAYNRCQYVAQTVNGLPVTAIAAGAIRYAKEEVSLPPTLETIATGAFFAGLDRLVIPASVRLVEADAFGGRIDQLIFEEGVTGVSKDAFSTLLYNEVVIPDSIRRQWEAEETTAQTEEETQATEEKLPEETTETELSEETTETEVPEETTQAELSEETTQAELPEETLAENTQEESHG